MSSKKKEIVWHKKRGGFINSSLVKPHSAEKDKGVSQDCRQEKKKQLAESLSAKIKNAVRDSSK